MPLAVERKIKLNNITKSKYIIETYKLYSPYLNSTYQALSNTNVSPKEKVLRRLQNIYFEELNKYSGTNTDNIKIVQENSDLIFRGIKNEVKNIVFSSLNNNSKEEEIDIAINVILADAFVNCNIMESED